MKRQEIETKMERIFGIADITIYDLEFGYDCLVIKLLNRNYVWLDVLNNIADVFRDNYLVVKCVDEHLEICVDVGVVE